MTRTEVYARLDGERDYQDAVWGGKTHDNEKEVGCFLVYMQHYLNRSIEKCTTSVGTADALHEMRKVAALAVACFEVHGVPERVV